MTSFVQFSLPSLGYRWSESSLLQCEGDMWQGPWATCSFTPPCLSGFPRVVSDPRSQHCPALLLGRCGAMTHLCDVLALPDIPWPTAPGSPPSRGHEPSLHLGTHSPAGFYHKYLVPQWWGACDHVWWSVIIHWNTENCRACLICEVSSVNLKHSSEI